MDQELASAVRLAGWCYAFWRHREALGPDPNVAATAVFECRLRPK